MPATVYRAASAADLEFGITNETGIILTNFSRTVSSNKSEVMDAEGTPVAVAYTGTKGAIKLEGYLNGSVTMQIAATLALNNDTSLYGLSGGTVIVDQVAENTGSGEFKKIAVDATQYSESMTAS